MRSSAGDVWKLIVVYVIPTSSIWQSLWCDLKSLHVNVPGGIDWRPQLSSVWTQALLGGETLSKFLEVVQYRELLDLGFIGPCYKWNHGNLITSRRSAQLDQGLCDDSWKIFFLNIVLKHLPPACSDYCPLLMQLEGNAQSQLGEDHLDSRWRGSFTNISGGFLMRHGIEI